MFSGSALALARPGRPSRETVIANAGRAALAVVTATTFFFALGQLPLAEALVLTFLSPMFVALFGALMLGERPDRRLGRRSRRASPASSSWSRTSSGRRARRAR